ncbi:uncharacterized protein LOC109806182 [Cajanus cajan]|uniref:uncharacterized protein LOC109806182 n=1 Tax=Cajanus cajan TaxID=3821 RepID=UPI00098DC8FA|nr:uncharacterized protein LOC109806182 [Cajanus cajan]
MRISNLPTEYWAPRILQSIAAGAGEPILIDAATLNHAYGHFARVLVELDMNEPPPQHILVEREGYAFNVNIVYENLLEFCFTCHNIGHNVSTCRNRKKSNMDAEPEELRTKLNRKREWQRVSKKSASDPNINKAELTKNDATNPTVVDFGPTLNEDNDDLMMEEEAEMDAATNKYNGTGPARSPRNPEDDSTDSELGSEPETLASNMPFQQHRISHHNSVDNIHDLTVQVK